ncbi:MAG TPA: hypothetical protein VLI39_04600 [Sedimentisphaerales bacterium]|nr:hypothetical protein [Sedimentisphaerales bacterium]
MGESKGTSRLRRVITGLGLFFAAACIMAAVGFWVFSRMTVGVDAQLAAIDAAHAVPPGENAANDWIALVRDANTPPPDPRVLPVKVQATTVSHSWRSADQPQVAKWMQDNQAVLTALLRIADKPRCWFSVSDVNRPGQDYSLMEIQGAILVVRAANNDLGENRPEAALEKLLAALRIAGQLSSQAHLAEFVAGWEICDTVVERIIWVVANYHVPDSWLAKFEAQINAIEDSRSERFREYCRVARLHIRKYGRTGPRLVQTLIGLIPGRTHTGLFGTERTLVRLRGGRIVFALRRYKDAKGEWPQSLSEIQANLPREALVDPLSKRAFVYRQSHDSFVLYSVGSNGVDDGGLGDDCRVSPQ